MTEVCSEANLAASGQHFLELKKKEMLPQHLLPTADVGRYENLGQSWKFSSRFSPIKREKKT